MEIKEKKALIRPETQFKIDDEVFTIIKVVDTNVMVRQESSGKTFQYGEGMLLRTQAIDWGEDDI